MKRVRGAKRQPKKSIPFRMKVPFIVVRASTTTFMAAVAGLIAFSYQQLFRSDFFVIKNCRMEMSDRTQPQNNYDELLQLGKEKNILLFDSKATTEKALKDHQELKNLQIIKTFPDTLVLKAELRSPVAQVGDHEFYLVDRNGITLTAPTKTIKEDLPVMTGAEWNDSNKVGYIDKSSRMKKGLELLTVMKETGFLNEHTLEKIDISDARNIAFVIEDGLEVKIGNTDFAKRLDQLNNTLESIVVDKGNISYIDLRFAEVVLGTK